MNNPCISGRDPEETICPFVGDDKNDEPCLNCLAKLEYAVNQGMLHPEVLEPKQEDLLIIEARKTAPKKKQKLCKDCRRPKPIKARNRCSTCYVRWRYHNSDKVRGYRKRGTE